MDELFGEIDCRSKSDAIVMSLLRSAMDEAHEKVQCQNGPIEFLHQRSKFYELAAILVDGGLSIVEEEVDIQETTREKMLSDLTEIRHWLQRRIAEMRILIIEKDQELMQRVENELKLRRAAELNERELVYLREKLATERTKGADLQDYVPRTQETEEDQVEGGDIGELKNSVDQQVLNIKQKLEDERRILRRRVRGRSSRSSDSELYSKIFDEDIHSVLGWTGDGNSGQDHISGIASLKSSLNSGKDNVMIRQMSSDIDILKGTLDLAFGRMRNAEVFPLEMQWRWSIEKETIVVSMKGFINDIQQCLRTGFEKKGWSLPVGFRRVKWTDLINEARDLHDELIALCSQTKVDEKRSEMQELSCPPLPIKRTISEPLPEVLCKVPEKDSDPGGSHYVAKMVKSHESFIQKQREREEWNWLAREIVRRKGFSSVKRDKDPDELESRVRKVIERLDNLMNWEGNQGYIKGFCENTIMLEASLTEIERTATENINAGSGADLSNEIRKLEQERDDLKLQVFLIEEIYLLVLGGFVESLQLEKFDDENKSFIRGDSHRLSLNDFKNGHVIETNNLHNQKIGELEEAMSEIQQQYLESYIREGVYAVYLQETVSVFNSRFNEKVEDGLVREDVNAVYLQETVTESNSSFNENVEDFLVKQEIMRFVFSETMHRIEQSSNFFKQQLQMEIEGSETLIANHSCGNILPETVGSIIKEDIYVVYVREFLNVVRTEIDDYCLEIVIKEGMHHFILVEMVKEFYLTLQKSEASDQMQHSKYFPSTELDVHEKESLIEKPDSCFMNCNSGETANASTKELADHSDEVAEHDSMELLSSDDDDGTYSTASSKQESLDKGLISKDLVLHVEENSELTAKDEKEYDHQGLMHPIEVIDSKRQHVCCQLEENEVFQQNQNVSVFLPIMGFQQILTDFEQMVHKKLQVYCSRVDMVKHQINALAEPAASVRKKKMLYEKAFLTRCHNLQIAETEVDLLGNQVEKLMCLLQNIYLVLCRNSTILSQYFGVLDILTCIKKELAEEAA